MRMAEGELTKRITRSKTPKDFKEGDNFMLVVAIDFGTTYSGYAFSFTSSPEDVKANGSWGSEVGATRYKTPSCVLTDDKNNLLSFGYEALNLYAEEDDSNTTYHLFDRFKMKLYNEKVIGAKTTIASRTGRILPADMVISYALTYLYNHVMKTLKSFTAGKINSKQIRWILTVPAIWSESAKQMMRRAAWKAGIIDSLNSKRLQIALEPEAASFWCRDLPLDKFKCDAGDEEATRMPDETSYMVVDCGGGTIDITVHKLDFDGTVKEVYRASGGNWGGTCVDDKFTEILTDVLGQEFLHQYRKECPHDWLDFCEQFETKKRSAGGDKKGLKLPLTYGLGEGIKEKHGKSAKDVITEAQIAGVSFKNGMLVFDKQATDQLFLPSVNNIIKHVKDLLSKPKVADAKYMFMVGGYSDCAILQEQMMDNFGSKLQIMIPEEPGMCVMKGAVLFGHYPDTITSRIARKTYGEDINVRFVEGKHDPEKKVVVEGITKCEDVFKIWVKKNESIETDEIRSFGGVPNKSDQTCVVIKIYSTDKEADDVMYVTDPGVQCIGSLRVEIPDTHLPRKERRVKRELFFGSTEICVRAHDTARKDGDIAETNIDFLCE